MSSEALRLIVAVVAGGIFGWSLGRMPDKYVYVVIALCTILVIVLMTRAPVV